jgi:hypothetical protein
VEGKVSECSFPVTNKSVSKRSNHLQLNSCYRKSVSKKRFDPLQLDEIFELLIACAPCNASTLAVSFPNPDVAPTQNPTPQALLGTQFSS